VDTPPIQGVAVEDEETRHRTFVESTFHEAQWSSAHFLRNIEALPHPGTAAPEVKKLSQDLWRSQFLLRSCEKQSL